MKKPELLTKEEIAVEMSDGSEPLSIRSVERYIQIAGVEPAVKGSGRGKLARYARADVERIKSAYREAAERREQQKPDTALTTTKPAALAPVALVGELLAGQTRGFESLQAALDTWPIWLTRREALERSGLPAAWFDRGVRAGKLPTVGSGRGRRFHRDDVRAYARSVRDGDYLKELLGKTRSTADG
jgi:hypothetical protein